MDKCYLTKEAEILVKRIKKIDDMLQEVDFSNYGNQTTLEYGNQVEFYNIQKKDLEKRLLYLSLLIFGENNETS